MKNSAGSIENTDRGKVAGSFFSHLGSSCNEKQLQDSHIWAENEEQYSH